MPSGARQRSIAGAVPRTGHRDIPRQALAPYDSEAHDRSASLMPRNGYLFQSNRGALTIDLTAFLYQRD
jgi:hypothetical protein